MLFSNFGVGKMIFYLCSPPEKIILPSLIIPPLTLVEKNYSETQARNQLGTLRGAKSFLRGPQNF